MKKVVQLYTVSMSIRFLEGLSEPLRKAGYELIVISADGPEARMGERNGEFLFYPVEMARGISPVQNFKAWLKVRRILKREQPDIVHGNTPIGGLIALSAACSLGIKNRVFTLHGLKYPGEQGVKRFIVRTMEKLSLILAQKVFAVSEGLRQYACDEGLIKKNKISVLHHGSVKGIDTERSEEIRKRGRAYYEEQIGLEHDTFRFGYFGRINEEKGIEELLTALEILNEKGCSFEMIFCGAPEFTKFSLKEHFEMYADSHRVKTYGMVMNPLDYMMCCDCIVLPTHREGFGLVNIEANSLGIPVVTTDVMGCRDSIEANETGLFAQVDNPIDLANKMEYLYFQPEERKRMGCNGISRVEAMFRRSDIWAQLINEYNTMK